MSQMKNKQWSKPQLIVLVRGKIENQVLAACKTGGQWWESGGGPHPGYRKCYYSNCGPCWNQPGPS